MKTLYDVQQLLKQFNILVHVGKRKWDIELMGLELDNLHLAGVISEKEYMTAKLILRHQYEIEEQKEASSANKDKGLS
ncbi:YqgQ family protein [Lactobacillus sp.]|uniref:YqgQ family protein n=1 Tax=Lactobacillus sp. TaxID=1591 RepID=UPI0019B91D62|nr:YqgQ family protein [Lactobacillus sp.]MBD5429921.1 YqgQ family protein [Lactobacillus sp.]